MNRLVIIGNGFDLAHGLKTSYTDFIDWYWGKRIKDLKNCNSGISKDELSSFSLFNNQTYYGPYSMGVFVSSVLDSSDYPNNIEALDVLLSRKGNLIVQFEPLLESIMYGIGTKNWAGIENDYYELLKANADNVEACELINKQLDIIKDLLIEYLGTLQSPDLKIKIQNAFKLDVFDEDVSSKVVLDKQRELKKEVEIFEAQGFPRIQGHANSLFDSVEDTMLLSFNYTPTAEMYLDETTHINYIHGSLDKPKEMIFGYGDEMDKDFQALIDRNENALLENSKSIKYLETSHYRDLLSFIEGGPFQVYIMGHSCGNSDRTLLNTIFEHQNCISIKPFCYINNENNEDNYSELTRNIYRNFTDKKLFRDRVVNKERCTTLDGHKLGCQTQAETH